MRGILFKAYTSHELLLQREKGQAQSQHDKNYTARYRGRWEVTSQGVLNTRAVTSCFLISVEGKMWKRVQAAAARILD